MKMNLSSRPAPYGVSPSAEPDVRLSRIRLLTGLMTYVFLRTHGILPLYVFRLSPHLSAVAVSFEEYAPGVAPFPPAALPALIGTMRLFDRLQSVAVLR